MFHLHSRSQSDRDTADESLDAGQDGLLIACEDPVIGTVELDERRLRDVAGEMPAGTDAYGAVASPVEHKRRNRNLAQKIPHVRIAQRLEQALEGPRDSTRP